MSDTYPPFPPREEGLPSNRDFPAPAPLTPATPDDGGQGKTDVAKEQAAHLGNETAAAGQKVAGVAKDEASKVADETKGQAKDLFREAQGQLTEQAAEQQKKVASGLRSVSDELKSMASNSEQGGMATDLVHEAASRAGSVASWLDDRDPGALLDEVRQFARERPGTFIGIAAVAGVLAGRLTRSLASESSDGQGSASPSSASSGTAGARPSGAATAPRPSSSSPVYDGEAAPNYEAAPRRRAGEYGGSDPLRSSSFERPDGNAGDSPVGRETL